jgi:hypothetical protein
MSTGHESAPSYASAPPFAARRPLTLVLAFWGSVTVALLSAIGSVMAITGGKESIRAFATDMVRDVAGDDANADLIEEMISSEIASAYDTLVTKAVVGIVLAVLVLVCALLIRGGSLKARIALTVTLVLLMCGGSGLQLGDADAMPDATVAMAVLSPVLSLIVIVLLFLPATNRYAATRR